MINGKPSGEGYWSGGRFETPTDNEGKRVRGFGSTRPEQIPVDHLYLWIGTGLWVVSEEIFIGKYTLGIFALKTSDFLSRDVVYRQYDPSKESHSIRRIHFIFKESILSYLRIFLFLYIHVFRLFCM